MQAVPNDPDWIVVFDFDKSLLDWTDTDAYIYQQLNPDLWSQLREQWHGGTFKSWTKLVDQGLGNLHGIGITKEQILDCYSKCLLTEASVQSLHFLRQRQCYVAIASDSNTTYIDTILQASKASDLVHLVATNRSSWTPEGRLTVSAYQPEGVPHDCHRCDADNMCKSYILRDIIASVGRKRIIYVGDGGNDYCPCTILGKDDFILARKDLPLHKHLRKDTSIQASVISWETSSDYYLHLQEILRVQ